MYDPKDASLPDIEAFMKQIMLSEPDKLNRPELYELLHRVIGYLLTGVSSEQCMFFFVGASGANGKGLLVKKLQALLGSLIISCDNSLLMASKYQKQGGGTSSDVARLKAKRVAVIPELKDCTIDDQTFKTYTGDDKVTARGLWKEEEEFDMTAKLLLLTNFMPLFQKCSGPVIRRMYTIPFEMQACDEKDDKRPYNKDDPTHVLKDKELASKLSVSALLAWAVQGSVKYYEKGLGEMPACCKELRNAIIDGNDPLQEWIDTDLVKDDDNAKENRASYMTCAGAYERYKAYLLTKPVPPPAPRLLKDMHAMMAAKGIVSIKSNRTSDNTRNQNVYVGYQHRRFGSLSSHLVLCEVPDQPAPETFRAAESSE